MQDNASFWRNYDELVTVELDVTRLYMHSVRNMMI